MLLGKELSVGEVASVISTQTDTGHLFDVVPAGFAPLSGRRLRGSGGDGLPVHAQLGQEPVAQRVEALAADPARPR